MKKGPKISRKHQLTAGWHPTRRTHILNPGFMCSDAPMQHGFFFSFLPHGSTWSGSSQLAT